MPWVFACESMWMSHEFRWNLNESRRLTTRWASPKLPAQENCEKLRAPVKSWDGSTTNHADGLPATMLFETAILAALQLLKSQQCGGLWRKLRKLGNNYFTELDGRDWNSPTFPNMSSLQLLQVTVCRHLTQLKFSKAQPSAGQLSISEALDQGPRKTKAPKTRRSHIIGQDHVWHTCNKFSRFSAVSAVQLLKDEFFHFKKNCLKSCKLLATQEIKCSGMVSNIASKDSKFWSAEAELWHSFFVETLIPSIPSLSSR